MRKFDCGQLVYVVAGLAVLALAIAPLLWLDRCLRAEPPPAAVSEEREAPALEFPPRSGTWEVLPVRIIDGDTFELRWLVKDVARLNRLNCPEKNTEAGVAAQRFLESKLWIQRTRVVSKGRDKFGRALLEVYTEKGENLTDLIVKSGHGHYWDGKGPRP